MAAPISVRGYAVRIGCQDECDKPITETPNTAIASDGFISLDITPDIEEGEELIVKLANGRICVQDRDDSCIKGLELTLMWCKIDPVVQTLLMGGGLLLNADGSPKGGVLPGISETDKFKNSKQLELWSRSSKGGCASDADACPYIRWILPRTINWTLDESLTFENGGHQMFGFKGYAEANANFCPLFGDDDPDLTAADVDTIRQFGPLAYTCSSELPEFSAECDYLPPLPALPAA